MHPHWKVEAEFIRLSAVGFVFPMTHVANSLLGLLKLTHAQLCSLQLVPIKTMCNATLILVGVI